MSEDITAQIRTAISVVIAATLVAVVLNLVAMAGSILATGSGTLKSGVDQINVQEWSKYTNANVGGIDVKSAIHLYESRDIAIVIRNSACIKGVAAGTWGYNYGALVEGVTLDAGNSSGVVYKRTTPLKKNAGESWYTVNLLYESGAFKTCTNTNGVETTGDTEFVLESARFRSELIKDTNGMIIGICFTQTSGVD